MKHVCPIIPWEHLEPVLKVFPQLGPVVFGELFGAGRGPFGFHTVDLEGGVEPIDKGSKELGFDTAETHPFPVGAGVDAVKGSATVEAVESAWFGEVGGVIVGVEKGEGGDVAGARDLWWEDDEQRRGAVWTVYHVSVDDLTASAFGALNECQEDACRT